MITVVLADDEPNLLLNLYETLVHKISDIQIVAMCADGDTALNKIADLKPDLAILDITMPGNTGLEIAKKVQEQQLDTVLVFLTAHEEFALDAYKNRVFDYILKPFTSNDLHRVFERFKKVWRPKDASVRSSREQQAETHMQTQYEPNKAPENGENRPLEWLVVGTRNGSKLLQLNDIAFFRSDTKYTSVVTNEHEYLIRKTIKELEQVLPLGQFVRVHRNCIINTNYVDIIEKSTGSSTSVKMKTGQTLAVSRTYQAIFKEF